MSGTFVRIQLCVIVNVTSLIAESNILFAVSVIVLNCTCEASAVLAAGPQKTNE